MGRWIVRFMAVAAIGAASSNVGAGEYTFDLPELVNAPYGSIPLTLDLGGPFSSISSARLRVIGWHTPGQLGDLSSTAVYPYPAQINAFATESPPTQSSSLGTLLPEFAGPFSIDKPFLKAGGAPPTFPSWLGGTASFTFSSGPSAYAMIFVELSKPQLTVAAASLVITGQRASAPHTADFDGDGAVDSQDLASWQSVYGDAELGAMGDADNDGDADGADFLAWQREVDGGTPAALAATSVPEPGAVGLIAWFGFALAARQLRRSAWIGSMRAARDAG